MSFAWCPTTSRLRFRLGEVTLFCRHLSLLNLDAHFTELTNDPSEPKPPLESVGVGFDGALVRSHPISELLPPLCRTAQAIRYVPHQYRRFYTDLTGSFEDYLRRFSAKSRSTLRRKLRKFEEFSGGSIQWREYAALREMEEFYRLARALSVRTYQERLLAAGLPDTEAFQKEMFARAAEDRVRGWILFHCERPIAYLYCPLVRDGILVYLYLGYDPEYQAWSPGTVLHFLVLRKLFQDGRFRMFDFAEGEGGHKEFLSTHHVLCADIYWIRPTLRNRVLLRLHILVEMVNTLAGRLLAALGLKTGLKRLIRRRICPPGTYET